MITFLTGIYGSGKTTTARSLPGRYVDYDASHDYQAADHDPAALLATLQPGDVVDAIPFRTPAAGRHKWDRFRAWSEGRDVRVLVTVCSHKTWMRRVGKRADEKQWSRFMVEAFGLLPHHAEWLSTESGKPEPITREQAASLVNLRGALKDYVTTHALEWHDAKYQDIAALDFRGYSDSRKSWDTIRGLVDWKGKRVVDAGCNHGYFALETWKAGAPVVHGLDQHAFALAVAGCAALLDGAVGVLTHRWAAGDPIPSADVLLCLNAVHHFGDKADAFIADGADAAPVAIYEAGLDWSDRLRAHYSTVTKHPSHRGGRVVFRCEK